MTVLPKRHSPPRPCRRHPLGEPWGHLFRLQSPMVHLYSHCGASVRPLCDQSGAKDRPRCPKGAKKEPKSSLLGAQSVTFGSHIGESCPMPKPLYLQWFCNILRVRAPPFSHSKSTRERNVHQKLPFLLFYAHFWRQSDAQGRPKGARRKPKGSKRSLKASPGTPTNH